MAAWALGLALTSFLLTGLATIVLIDVISVDVGMREWCNADVLSLMFLYGNMGSFSCWWICFCNCFPEFSFCGQ